MIKGLLLLPEGQEPKRLSACFIVARKSQEPAGRIVQHHRD